MPRRRRSHEHGLSVILITGSCCIPGLAAIEEQAQRLVEQAIADSGVTADLKVMPATSAYFGAVPKQVVGRLMSDFQAGRMPVPAVLVAGELVSSGVPDPEAIKDALVRHATRLTTEEHSHA